MLVKFEDFISTGAFGSMKIGMLRCAVLNEVGVPPLFKHGRSLDDAELWINGRATFWFSGQHLEQIGVYYTLKYPANGAIQYDVNFPGDGALVDNIKEFARKIGIAVSHRPGERYFLIGKRVRVVVGSGGRLASILYPGDLRDR